MSGRIRPIALALIRRGDAILVFDAYDSVKGQRFHRPLGGGIEFGERAADALARELREETGFSFRVGPLLGVLESVFVHEGAPGHEIAFVFGAESEDAAILELDELEVVETIRGEEHRLRAIWVDPARVDVPVYPDGLLDLIANAP